MREYVLVSDSTADLPIDVIKELGIKIIPFSYAIEDETCKYYLDERDDINQFYNQLSNGAMPVTSQVNPTLYKESFEEIVKEGKDILYLCFTSGLSGSYQSSQLGKDMILEDYPEANITIIDTLCASVGEGVLVYLAAKLKQAGKDIEEVAQWIEENKTNIRHWFMVEDLFHLSRGGRLSAVGAMVGSALKIKPILSVDEEGKLVVKAKTRGTNKALDYLISKVKEEGGDLDKLVAVVGHAADIEKAEKIKAMAIEAGMKSENILIAPIGPIIGTHVGVGMGAIAFLMS